MSSTIFQFKEWYKCFVLTHCNRCFRESGKVPSEHSRETIINLKIAELTIFEARGDVIMR